MKSRAHRHGFALISAAALMLTLSSPAYSDQTGSPSSGASAGTAGAGGDGGGDDSGAECGDESEDHHW